MLRAGELEANARADWLDLVATCKQVEGRKTLRLPREFVVTYGTEDQANQVIVPAGAEVVFYCLYPDHRLYRTEGVLHHPDGTTISILGYGERAVLKNNKAETRRRAAKSVQVKPPSTRNTLDATPWPMALRSALL